MARRMQEIVIDDISGEELGEAGESISFSLDGNDNLKAKRRVANSLKQKTRNKFNVAIAEAGTEDSLTLLRLAVVSISNSETHLRSRMDKCALMMEAVCPEEMVDSQVEIYAAD